MPFILSIILLLICAGIWPEVVRAESSMRCEDRTVSLEDAMRDVEDACGPPTFVDAYQEERTIKVFKKVRRDPKDKGEKPDKDKEEDA